MGTTDHVASFTDAWIETVKGYTQIEAKVVASFTDAWIETVHLWHISKLAVSHLLQMRGLKQKPILIIRTTR